VSGTRERVAEHVAANPGVHFNGVGRALDIATGQVQYHLRRLRRDGRVVAEDCCGRTHYYPTGYDAWERRALALLRRETSADVVALLVRRGPTRPAEVAAELDLAASTVAYHADRLVDHDVLARRPADGGGTHLVLERPADTAALLAETEPTLPGRLVDRFTRLLDRLLEEP
jgi:predicted transcriptional regulator